MTQPDTEANPRSSASIEPAPGNMPHANAAPATSFPAGWSAIATVAGPAAEAGPATTGGPVGGRSVEPVTVESSRPGIRSVATPTADTGRVPSRSATVANELASDQADERVVLSAAAVDPVPGVRQLLIFLAAAAAFVCVAFRMTLKLAADWSRSRSHRPVLWPMPAEAPATDLRTVLARASRATRDPIAYRPSDPVAKSRWDAIERAVRQQPHSDAHDDALSIAPEATPVRSRVAA